MPLHAATVASVIAALAVCALCQPAHPAVADGADSSGPRLDLYGFLELNMGHDFGQNDPDWYDVSRPSKLPATPDEFGHDGRTFASVRPSRLGLKGVLPSAIGDVRGTFEFDAFGSDQNVGQTAFRLRIASVELEHFGAGLTYSPFMDPDISPASLEFFGPSGVVSFRNVLVYWRPLTGDRRLTFALERPGASGDEGIYADRIELQNVRLRFPLPDLTSEYRIAGAWGHLKVAAVVRTIEIDDLNQNAQVPSTRETGWGLSVSSNVKPSDRDVLHFELVYGRGIENYVNDAPIDVAAETRYSPVATTVGARVLPVLGATAFVDHAWNSRWSSTLGYSLVDITNSNAQTADAFRRGHYALVNLVHSPIPSLRIGGEIQWARRENFRDGFAVDDLRFQFTVKFSFSTQLALQH